MSPLPIHTRDPSTYMWSQREAGHTRVKMLTRVWQELNNVSMCAVSPVVHTSNISSCQKKKKLFQFSCGCEQFH